MELIISALAAVCAFLGSIAAHFIAHDAYFKAPKYARRLIAHAARKLPPLDRARYEEEWLADLHERDGVLAKLRHAFECVLCARKLAGTVSHRAPQVVQFVFSRRGDFEKDSVTGEPVETDLSTGLFAAYAFSLFAERPEMTGDEVVKAVSARVPEVLRKHGLSSPADGAALDKIITTLKRCKASGRGFGVRFRISHGTVDARAIFADLFRREGPG
jgi:hypothetical protein